MSLFAIASIGSGIYNAFRQKREIDQERRNINRSIQLLNRERDRLGADNQTAYSRAIAFLSSNRSDPNAWRTASSMYDSAVSNNAAQEGRLLGTIADLQLRRPKRMSGFEALARTGITVGNALMMDKILSGKEGGSMFGWLKKAKAVPVESLANNPYLGLPEAQEGF